MGGKSPKAPVIQMPAAVEEQAPDTQVSAKRSRDRKRGSSSGQGLNRFLITPSSGSGANVPE